jgi:uncharacterized membrane protein
MAELIVIGYDAEETASKAAAEVERLAKVGVGVPAGAS